ncbi:MAG: alpha/beta fold hydrolase [Pseudomonadota bacterium]
MKQVPALVRCFWATLLIQLLAWPAFAGEEILTASGPQGNLEGTFLEYVDGDAPVMLLIPGSGPTDRDGNNPLGLKGAIYRALGQGLLEAGVSSLRVDKRGFFGSSAALSNPNDVVLKDYAEDTRNWIGVLMKRVETNCVWVAGHSEGALVALFTAQKSQYICGLILISPPGRKFGDILRQQLMDNPANSPILEDAFSAIDNFEDGKKTDVADMHPALQQLFNPEVQDYIIDLMSHNPAELIAAIELPMLIVQGGKDLQVSVLDATILSKANTTARLVIIPDVNHALKDVQGNSRAENFATYTNPDLSVSSKVTEAIAGFIRQHKE